LQTKTKTVSIHTADSKPVKQEVNGTVILPILVFPDTTVEFLLSCTEFHRISPYCVKLMILTQHSLL